MVFGASGVCAKARVDTAAATARPISAIPHRVFTSPLLSISGLAAFARGLLFFHEQEQFVIQQTHVWFLTAIEEHAHLPGPREHLRVLDRDLVAQVIGALERVALEGPEVHD